MEHALPAKDDCVLCVETEYDTDTELIEALQRLLVLRIFVLLQEGIIKLTNKLTGLQGDLHLIGDLPDLFVHKEVEHVVFFRKLHQRDLNRIRFHSISIINPDLSKIRSDNPAGTLIKRQVVIVHLRLLVWRHSAVSSLWLIKTNAETLLLYKDVSLRNIDINSLRVTIAADNLLLELHAICYILHSENILKNVDPIGTSVFIFFSLAVPLVEKLSSGFSLLRISHCQHHPSS